MIEIIPTVVPASVADIEAAAARYSQFAKTLHVDITDGVFAPNTTWMPSGELLQIGMQWEAHLMVSDPHAVGLASLTAGASRVIGHIEAAKDVAAMFAAWKAAGAQEVGLGVLFTTAIESLDPYVDSCDVAQMMSIAKIGVQGIPYEPSAPARIASLHAKHPELLIADDGGVGSSNIMDLARAGVRRFCAGSSLSKPADPAAAYRELLALAESAVQ